MKATTGHSTLAGGGDPSNPDADLIRLGAELAGIVEAETAWPDDADDAMAAGALFERGSAIVEAILRHKARTLAGVQVKARALAWCAADDDLGADMFTPGNGEATTDLRLAGSIAGDLLAMGADGNGPCGEIGNTAGNGRMIDPPSVDACSCLARNACQAATASAPFSA